MNSIKKFSDVPKIETERLILRKITLDDAEDMFIYASNEEVTRYVTWITHSSLSDTIKFINAFLPQYDAPWGIEFKENGRFIGTVHFVWWQPEHNSAEIGYVLSKEYWGKGLITEAARAIITFGFESMDLIRIQARCFLENKGSERVMEKLGMSFEGISRKVMYVKGEHKDLKVYSILKF
ncbi:ribosomal-protein-alanine N-acetyltransferase [Bacillus pakistanensis]|uniref:Ribosomal-protein-alanine N-acetyltransferase n=1 Tax=Rossellomorea pakistanensis TaxID=992288 RepID=A0ABS2NF33_9BACI|nr:GNAT family N-acetyltransferase [Bacillus pakistanensis]MBM7586472.1 ribosomal-protein-alanine N-acetyltransferase [Bacillus pakistanensis]